MYRVDLNCDLGESFGAYKIGSDEAILKFVTSANIACGFHAGDPGVMRKTVKLALANQVAIGAHPGLPDLIGFGRRNMSITPQEAYEMVVYQIGALAGFVKAEGGSMQHVKPHGILYRMVGEQERYIEAFLDTIEEYDKDLYIMLHTGCEALKRAKKRGLKTAPEVLIDLGYDTDGNWILERVKKARSPQEVAERAVRAVCEKTIDTVDGKMIHVEGVTVCIHGDAPNAVAVATAVHQKLKEAGVLIKAL